MLINPNAKLSKLYDWISQHTWIYSIWVTFIFDTSIYKQLTRSQYKISQQYLHNFKMRPIFYWHMTYLDIEIVAMFILPFRFSWHWKCVYHCYLECHFENLDNTEKNATLKKWIIRMMETRCTIRVHLVYIILIIHFFRIWTYNLGF